MSPMCNQLEIPVIIIGVLKPYHSHQLGAVLREVSGQAIKDVFVSLISVNSDQTTAKI